MDVADRSAAQTSTCMLLEMNEPDQLQLLTASAL
jgi:hypothetical protein